VAGFIVRRLLSAALVVIVTSMFVFALFFLGPSNPARPLCDLNGRCTPEKLALLTEQMGLNDSVVNQYGIWAKGLVQDRVVSFGPEYPCDAPCLGISYSTKGEVTSELLDKFPATLSLAVGGAATYLVLGVILGTLAARWRGTAADRSLVTMSLVISSIPYYVVALLAWIFFSLEWGIFEDTSYHPITQGVGPWFWGLLLPWLVLGVTNSTSYARFTRGQMVETLSEDYIRTATAKGVKSNVVIFKHALRAAIVPVITIFGLDFAFLLAGTVFTEKIFDIDGIGRWGIDALRAPVDFPVVQATVLVGAVIIVLANIIVDVLYSVIDPRVRVS
jgi:peptide/nickel transport system permease protein